MPHCAGPFAVISRFLYLSDRPYREKYAPAAMPTAPRRSETRLSYRNHVRMATAVQCASPAGGVQSIPIPGRQQHLGTLLVKHVEVSVRLCKEMRWGVRPIHTPGLGPRCGLVIMRLDFYQKEGQILSQVKGEMAFDSMIVETVWPPNLNGQQVSKDHTNKTGLNFEPAAGGIKAGGFSGSRESKYTRNDQWSFSAKSWHCPEDGEFRRIVWDLADVQDAASGIFNRPLSFLTELVFDDSTPDVPSFCIRLKVSGKLRSRRHRFANIFSFSSEDKEIESRPIYPGFPDTFVNTEEHMDGMKDIVRDYNAGLEARAIPKPEAESPAAAPTYVLTAVPFTLPTTGGQSAATTVPATAPIPQAAPP